MLRRLAVAAATASLAALALASAASGASATSWRATIVGRHLQGGATVLIADGRGTINVKLTGAFPGQPVAVSVATATCPEVGSSLISFLTTIATSPSGGATARVALTPAQVREFNAALSARTHLAIVAFAPGDTGCGDLTGAPAVGTGRLRGAEAGVYTYDIRYPVVSGIDPAIAAKVNAVLRGAAEKSAESFVADARAALKEYQAESANQQATQTFSVSLARPTVLSVIEHFDGYVITDFEANDVRFPAFTFDLVTGRQLTLAELFRPGSNYLAALSRAAEPLLRPYVGVGFAGEFAFPKPENFEIWRLDSNGIRFTFNHSFPIPTASVTVPWTSLLDVVNRKSPIANLLPH